MGLHKVDDKRVFRVEKLPYKDHFDRVWRTKLQATGSEKKVKDFLRSKIETQQEFSVGTLFPKKSWPESPELMEIFERAGKSELQAAYMLGLLSMEVIIEDETEWLTTKTQLTNRDIATAFYWRKKGNGSVLQ